MQKHIDETGNVTSTGGKPSASGVCINNERKAVIKYFIFILSFL